MPQVALWLPPKSEFVGFRFPAEAIVGRGASRVPQFVVGHVSRNPGVEPDKGGHAASGPCVYTRTGHSDLGRGSGAHLRAELLRRYSGKPAMVSGGRTVGELLAGAKTRWTDRQRLADERQAADRARREAAAAAARERRLDELAADPERAWRRVAELIATKKPKEYDAAVTLLIDLKALGERDGQRKAFRGRMHQVCLKHARKPSLLDRIERAGLSASARL